MTYAQAYAEFNAANPHDLAPSRFTASDGSVWRHQLDHDDEGNLIEEFWMVSKPKRSSKGGK